ncbi:MAG: DUF2064 domain-containing protein, partial [Gemmatimonadetes bacterium]|nr:DUF2064 domain-containing protein [Gemmatimonadota bacterium]NIQ59734.1 DUF2064 domain-containing protein [Gemmatimonadota bacterium]NIU79931.1 DUF2064 domain-containing protein [Gammaproteobacteria bacterium]NIX25422.1 DUF2064 domain-containing protein [Actinomycetota bacterium]NIX48403.1 DUF2064 domain-containing protein [Gemmatimonadota bacterium]
RGQEGDDLGARLARAFEEVFERGIRRVLIVGSDHPTLPADRLAEGLERLHQVDVVFGPTDDGGYYAVGLRDAARERAAGLFSDVPWSTRDVLEATRANARALGLSVGTLDA